MFVLPGQIVDLGWEELHPLVGTAEGQLVDPVVGELVVSLMRGCTDVDTNVKRLSVRSPLPRIMITLHS